MLRTTQSGSYIQVWLRIFVSTGNVLIKGRAPLVRICGTFNQGKYINVLKNYVLPFKKQYHSSPMSFIYQHDGCGMNLAKIASTLLEEEKVEVLPWPAQSPGLNPIEHVRALMKY